MKEDLITKLVDAFKEETKKHNDSIRKIKQDTTYTEEAKNNTILSLKNLYNNTAKMKRDRILEAIKEMKLKEKTKT